MPSFYDLEAFDARCMTPYFGMGPPPPPRTAGVSTPPPSARGVPSSADLSYFTPNLFGGGGSSGGGGGGRSGGSTSSKTLQHRDTPYPFNAALFSPSQASALFQASSFGLEPHHHGGGGSGVGGAHGGAHHAAGFSWFPPEMGVSSASPLKFGSASVESSAAVAHHQHQSSMMGYHHHNGARGGAPGGGSGGGSMAPMLHDMGFNGALMFGAAAAHNAAAAGFDAYYPFAAGGHGSAAASFGMGSLGFPMHNIR